MHPGLISELKGTADFQGAGLEGGSRAGGREPPDLFLVRGLAQRESGTKVEGVYFGAGTVFCLLGYEACFPLGHLKFVKNLGVP